MKSLTQLWRTLLLLLLLTPMAANAEGVIKFKSYNNYFNVTIAANGTFRIEGLNEGIVTISDPGTHWMEIVSNSNQVITIYGDVTDFSCSGAGISMLDVSQCPTLTTLNCSDNRGVTLDVTNNTALTTLNCSDMNITTLDVTNNTALTTLICDNNHSLTTLNLTQNTALTTLDCSYSDLTALDLTQNTALTTLNCSANRLSGQLDLSQNTELKTVNCSRNELTSLSLPNSTSLTTVNCSYNKLTSLDVTKHTALVSLDCSSNGIVNALDVTKNTALALLDCSSNKISALDVTNNTKLGVLRCQNNQLSELNVTKNTDLVWLDCGGNQLPELDVTKNTKLSSLNCRGNQLSSLNVTQNIGLIYLTCDSNNLTELDLSQNTKLTTLYANGNKLTAIDLRNMDSISDNGAHITLSNNQLESILLPSSFPNLESFEIQNNRIKAAEMERMLTETNLTTVLSIELVDIYRETGNEINESVAQAMKDKGYKYVSYVAGLTPENIELVRIYDLGYATHVPRRAIRGTFNYPTRFAVMKVIKSGDKIGIRALNLYYVPANKPILVYGEEGYYYVGATTLSAAEISEYETRDADNILIPMNEAGRVEAQADEWVYILSKGRWGAGFYWQQNTNGEYANLRANSAYLRLAKTYQPYNDYGNLPVPVQGFSLEEGLITGINTVQQQPATGTDVFDLSGRRVSRAGKGIYIVNGKKVIH
ncbi:MAG: hypothetical protein HUK09_01255 [Bacteroidaceae bacterium]|nr:hypothetical protein [Bacteroidaceae bacterium]